MKNMLNNNNKFYTKLEEWYGKSLDSKLFEILHVDMENDQIYSVVFLMRKDNEIEIARVFPIGDTMQISIDCQADINTMKGIRQLIQYGGNFGRFEIEVD